MTTIVEHADLAEGQMVNLSNTDIRAVFEVIAGHANKTEIAAWSRKRKAIERVIDVHITPLEQKIIELNGQLMPHYDQLAKQRSELTEFCIHPIDMLVYVDGLVVCKFCEAKMSVPKPGIKNGNSSEA